MKLEVKMNGKKIGSKHLCMLCKQIFQSESELDSGSELDIFFQCGLPNSSDNGKQNKKTSVVQIARQ